LPLLRKALQLEDAALLRAIARAPNAWRHRSVPIGGKVRDLLIPAQWLKELQRRMLRRVLSPMPVHGSAYCARGRGVLEAVRVHARHRVLLHLDIKDFFPSVTTDRLRRAVARYTDMRTADVICSLTAVDQQLPQGAPTSVPLANIVLFRLDQRLAGLCRSNGLAYSRYVDDIGISGGQRLSRLEGVIRRIIEDDGWAIASKGGMCGPWEQHAYLGVIVNASPNLDRTYTDDLRFIAARLAKGDATLDPTMRARLSGRVLYLKAINEPLGGRLLRRFGEHLCLNGAGTSVEATGKQGSAY